MSFHFISGLPRSGSTLLAAILRQNPALHAGMSSPLASLVLALLRQMSQENEGAPFVTDAKREAVLRGVAAGYYADLAPGTTVLDTNRAWCAKLPLIARLWPDAKVIACVRDIGWIMDSLERIHRGNPLEPSKMFDFDPGGTVYGRVGALAGSDGLVGFALDALLRVRKSLNASALNGVSMAGLQSPNASQVQKRTIPFIPREGPYAGLGRGRTGGGLGVAARLSQASVQFVCASKYRRIAAS